jgi:Gas vesicle synthesis protein GvpL/GvpF
VSALSPSTMDTASVSPGPDSAASCKKYLFAVVYAAAPPCCCPGMDGKEVSIIKEGRLAVVAGGIPSPRIRPERRNLAIHQEVLKQLLAGTTPLPMSFGILADNAEAIRKMLRRNQSQFLEQLAYVAGKVEMGLRVTWDVPNIFEYFVNTHAELRVARDQLVGANRQPTQEEKIELGRLFDRLLSEDRESFTEQVERTLSATCVESKANKCRKEHEVINLACLVGRQNMDAFGDAVFQAAQMFDTNFAFDYNGPWAPHNFVDVSVTV